MVPKYLHKVKAVTEAGLLSLAGNRILVELLEEGERTTKSGLITNVVTNKSQLMADKAKVAVVLAVGPGYAAEDTGENVDLPYKPGDHVLVNQFGVKTFGDFFGISDYKPDTIGLITDDLVQGKISNFEQFQQVLRG